MNIKIASKALMHPFSILRRVGFNSQTMQRFERFRSREEKKGRVVSVLKWADGTWCLLALHCEKFGVVIVDEGQQIDAYEDAHALIEGGYLPTISLRWEAHA